MTKSWQYWIALVALVSYTGCSKPTSETPAPPAATSNSTTQTEPLITGQLVTTLTPASEVVTLFLESLKKGDAAQTQSLLTEAARTEINRRGLSIDPLGSAESSFRIGRTQYSDKAADAAYVEAEWVEPNEDGTTLKHGRRVHRSSREQHLAHLRHGNRYGCRESACASRLRKHGRCCS